MTEKKDELTVAQRTIVNSAKIFRNGVKYSQVEEFIELLDEGKLPKGISKATLLDQNAESFKRLLEVVFVGMVIGDKEMTAKELYKNLFGMLEGIHTVLTSNPPTHV